MANISSQSQVQTDRKCSSAVVCAFCHKSFKFNSTLRQHEKIHYGIKPHECEVCHRRFLHKGTLKCHKRLHTGEKPYKCPHCPKAFRGQTALNCHVFRHTKEGAKCPQCPMVFATSSIVKQHLKQVHTEERSQMCNICGMTYKHLKSLRLHIRNHQARVCPVCGTGFDSVYAMRKHWKRHIAEGLPFKCAFCNRAFEKESEIELHAKLRGRLFQCDICCHSFNKQIFLTNHNRRIHWRVMGLERLKVAEPKHGWNRQRVPRPKNKKELVEAVSSKCDNPQHASYNRKRSLSTDEVVGKDMNTCNEQTNVHPAIPQCTNNGIEKEDNATECILIEQPDLNDWEIGVGETPLDPKNYSNSDVNSQKREPKQFQNYDAKETPAISDHNQQIQKCTCLFCGLLCRNIDDLGHHKCETQRTVKADKRALICELCGNWYASAATLAIHRTNQHHGLRFKCEQCDRTFGFRCYLEKHISMYHQNMRIYCELCNKPFKYVQDLNVHRRQHADVKPFKCDKCPSTFRFPSSLRSHKILHQEEFPFECNLCGKKFRFNNSLRVHARLHIGVKEFKCEICERQFSTKAPMLRHMKVHDGGKQLSCVVCGAVFYKKIDLAIHQSKEHPKHDLLGKGTTVHKCTHCGKEFIKKSNLTAHSYIHEDVYRFPCHLCSQSFKQVAGLRSHLISFHKHIRKSDNA